ncbi:zinc ion binding [Striga asiatica]|uniref:Zinc ion binding n=1 Tax=Striga asiatica TaxID=4170 RepID=A0A5A7PGD4_STRAF|nr:zinc ion binding [Striga asiatica]
MKIALWVQIHNLPLHWLSAKTGIKAGKLFSSVEGREEVSPDVVGDGGKNKGSEGDKLVDVEVVADKSTSVVSSEGPWVVVSSVSAVEHPITVGSTSVAPMDLDSLKGNRVDHDNLVDLVVHSAHHSSVGIKPPKTFVRVTRNKNLEG